MKQFFPVLRSRWYATMVPAHAPLITIHEREMMRKRRLLSVVLLIMLATTVLFVIQSFLTRVAYGNQQSMNLITCSALSLSLWINRKGYLRSASLFFLLSALFGIILEIVSISSQISLAALFLWTSLLLLPVAPGLFLPFWGPLLCAFAEIVFMLWFVLIEQHAQIATMLSKSDQTSFLVFCCAIIACIGGFCALSAATNEKAVIQADRAIELEQAHQALTEAYTNQAQAHEKLETIHGKLEAAYATIHKQALTDGLTNLPNHRAILDQFSKELENAKRYNRPLSILFFDADRFKYVNDTYGHAAGDAVLRQIGERASRNLREGDTLGRFGGEEFVVLLPETSESEANIIAERIRARVAVGPVKTPEVEGGISITVSIGHATYFIDGDSAQMLLSQADQVMYLAKKMGRNQVRTAKEAREKYKSGTNAVYAR